MPSEKVTPPSPNPSISLRLPRNELLFLQTILVTQLMKWEQKSIRGKCERRAFSREIANRIQLILKQVNQKVNGSAT